MAQAPLGAAAIQGDTHQTKPNQTKPNQTKPNQAKPILFVNKKKKTSKLTPSPPVMAQAPLGAAAIQGQHTPNQGKRVLFVNKKNQKNFNSRHAGEQK